MQQGAQAFEPLAPLPGGQGVGHGDRHVLENAGFPVALDGAGGAVVPDARKMVDLLQGAQDLGQIMAALNLKMPVHEEVFVPSQAGEADRPPFKLALEVGHPQPGVQDVQG